MSSSKPRRVVVLDSETFDELVEKQDKEPSQTIAPIHSESPPAVAEPEPPVWLQGIPKRYVSAARDTHAKLADIPELQVRENKIQVGDEEFELASVLKSLCVPFTRKKVPAALQSVLEQHKVKCRNHLALTPRWHPYLRF